MKMPKFTLLFLLGVALSLGAHQAQPTPASDCGREGQKQCDGGCHADYLPEQGEVAEWYPGGDNYVPAPKDYRQGEGLCTRCGNIYEPICHVDDSPRCFIDAQAGVIMEPTEDGYCVPPQQQFGCGTTGLPPCPDKLVEDYGTLAVLSQRQDNQGWQLTASLGEIEDDGCLYSVHNLVLRFVKAPQKWLPAGHKCADVCIACGVPGHPVCPIESPFCMRRVSEGNLEKYRDGPTYQDEDSGICRALHCGSSTKDEDLPVCTEEYALTVLKRADTTEEAPPGYEKALDGDSDGCAEPYVKNANGLCTEGDAGGAPAVINEREYHCTREGMSLIDDQVIANVNDIINKQDEKSKQNVKNRLTPILNNKGKCVECGRGGDLPCKGMDFDGCMTHEGFMLDVDIGLCVSAPCGGSNVGLKSPPWGSNACGVVKPNWYDNDIQHSPINNVSNCLYFHNLDKEQGHCEPCGTPGNRCIEECVMGIAFQPIGTSEKGLGEFQFLDDSIRTSGPLKTHCKPFPEVKIYNDQCTEAQRLSDTDDFGALPPARIYSPQSSPTSKDPGYGTAINPDECLHPAESVERMYESTCPGSGGTPVSKFGQCGGKDYSGPTCCYGFAVCVEKSEFYSHCEGANVPSEFIPWHSNCGGEDAGTCELGSSCEETDGNSYCKPASQHIPHSGSSRNLRGSKAAAIGIGIGVLALLALAVIGAFVFGRRRGISKGQFKLSGWGDAETYANASNSNSVTTSKMGRPATPGQSTYLDLAAATEAEALQARKSQMNDNDPEENAEMMHLPTSDFGIGRRA